MKIAFKCGDAYSKEKRGYLASSRIRCHWLSKYWKEADDFFYPEEFPQYEGDFFNPKNQMEILKDYNVIILNKTYEYRLAKMLKEAGKIVIVDMCDPDHLSSHSSEGRKHDCFETLKYASAVVVNGNVMKRSVREVYKGLIEVIPDRMDIDSYEPRKMALDEGIKSVVWYGYSENLRVLEPYLKNIINMGIEITIISDKFFDNLFLIGCKFNPKDMITFKNYDPETFNSEVIKHDVVFIGKDKDKYLSKFKSNNRALTGWCLGMPVAFNVRDLKNLITMESKVENAFRGWILVNQKYDAKQSVEDYKNLINKLFLTGGIEKGKGR